MSKIKNPSRNHPNRGIVNFLIYEYADYFLTKFIPYYKGTMVDLGCGEAPYREFFLQYVERYIGVDWSSSLHNIRADVISDLNKKIDLPDGVADVVISISVMEHLCEPEVFLRESFRILKKGGVMILGVPF
jgi:ubiquinone/menaquinone biosynthesis C-methylase UbiE